MSIRSGIAAGVTACWLGLGGSIAAPAVAASSVSTATAPPQLTNAYPMGPQRLCCKSQGGVKGQASSNAHTGSSTGMGSQPTAGAGATHGGNQPTVQSTGGGSSGGVPAVLFIGFGAAAALLIVGVAAVLRTHRASLRLPAEGSSSLPATARLNDRSLPASQAAGMPRSHGARFSWERSRFAARTTAAPDELEYRRLDETGDAGGAFNLGVVLHQRGEVADAMAAYERAEQRGDPDAGFNLGVLLYEIGDLDGAEAAWRRSAGRGHVRAAVNLRFLSRARGGPEAGGATPPEMPGLAEFEELLQRRADETGVGTAAYNLGVILHERGDVPGATAAYERAERRGDPDAAFNLGVLLYEVGDFDGAEAAWRRDARRGHRRATENLEFLHRLRRTERPRAGVAGEGGE